MFRRSSTTKLLSFPALAFLMLTVFFSFFTCSRPKNGVLFEPSRNGTSCSISDIAVDQLSRSAQNYLQKTSEILGLRYNSEFYHTVVRTGFENLTALPKRVKHDTGTVSESADLISLLEFESCEGGDFLQETLTFLNELETIPEELDFSLPIEFAGNPLNGIGQTLTEPLSCQFLPAANRFSRQLLPLSELFAVLFSLLSITASLLTPGSRILVLFGTEHSFPDLFFSELRTQFTALITHLFPQTKLRLFSGFMRTSIRSSQIEERKTIVLLR